jgi:hypothetical protein
VAITTGTVIWNWDWYDGCPADSPYLPLIKLRPGLYEHGMMSERAEILRAASVPVTRLCEPNGSLAFVVTDKHAVLWHPSGVTEVLAMHPQNTDEGWYHVLGAMEYHLLQAGQLAGNGPCFATYQGLLAAFDRCHFTAASVAAVVTTATAIPVSKED